MVLRGGGTGGRGGGGGEGMYAVLYSEGRGVLLAKMTSHVASLLHHLYMLINKTMTIYCILCAAASVTHYLCDRKAHPHNAVEKFLDVAGVDLSVLVQVQRAHHLALDLGVIQLHKAQVTQCLRTNGSG